MNTTRFDAPHCLFGSVRDARRVCGVSRSGLYRLAAIHPSLLRKLGRTTLVDIALLRSILADLPEAKIQGSP